MAYNAFYPQTYEEQLGFYPWDNTQTVIDYFFKKTNPIIQSYDNLFNVLFKSDNPTNSIDRWAICIGKSLFQFSSLDAQKNKSQPDDRPLYWTRLKYLSMFKAYCYERNLTSSLPNVIRLLEDTSRNFTGVNFSKAPMGCKKILITGFDPFLLNSRDFPELHNIRQSNPSGCAALSLNNTFTSGKKAFIQSILFPVRYSDFGGSIDESTGMGNGIVERYLSPFMGKVDMLITISQGKPDVYCFDRFATLTRGGKIDNMGCIRPDGSPCLPEDEPPWLESTLPDSIKKGIARINEEYMIQKDGPILNGIPASPQAAVYSGPGGNYLSNEIFYRTARLRELWRDEQYIRTGKRPEKCTGHLHVPKLQDPAKIMPDGSIGEDINYHETIRLINHVKRLIEKAV